MAQAVRLGQLRILQPLPNSLLKRTIIFHENTSRDRRRNHRWRVDWPPHGQRTGRAHVALNRSAGARRAAQAGRIHGRDGRTRLLPPHAHDAGPFAGNGDPAPRFEQDRSPHPAVRSFSSGHRRRWHRRALGRAVPAHPTRMFRTLFENSRKIRREEVSGRPLHSGLGRYLRRTRTVLHARRKNDGRFRQGWKYKREQDRRRKYF